MVLSAATAPITASLALGRKVSDEFTVHYAALITTSCIATATNGPGGRISKSRRCRWHRTCGRLVLFIGSVGIVPECQDEAEYYTLQNALSWRIDPIATTEIETRLAAYGFDQHAISTEVCVQAREMFVLFEGLLNAAQTKRVLLLREIRNPRLTAGPISLRR